MNQHGRNYERPFVSRQKFRVMRQRDRFRSWGMAVGERVAENLCRVVSANGGGEACAVPIAGSENSYEVFEVESQNNDYVKPGSTP